MTLSTFTETVPTTNATFRTAALAWDTAIKAVGLLATSDTGQINFATVTKPTASNTKAGYAIYRFADSLQSSYPCYIRVDYGSGYSSANYLGLTITVGTSTDGAGTIGNAKTFSYQMTNTRGAYLSGVSGSASRLTLAMTYTYDNPHFVTIERIQDSTGADTSIGLVMVVITDDTSSSNAAPYSGQQVVYYSGTQPVATYNYANSAGTQMGAVLPYYNGTVTWAEGATNKVYVSPVFPIGASVHPPVQGLLVSVYPDIPQLSTYTINHYGSAANWLAPYWSNGWYLGYQSVGAPLVRWE